jgi:hypothetical protein
MKNNPDGITQEDLISSLGLESSQALGGVFSGIGKHAYKLGIYPDDMYNYEWINNKGVFKLTEDMKKIMNENG